MRFPAKITSSCVWVAIPVDWVIFIGLPVVWTDGLSVGVRSRDSRMGRLLHFLTHEARQSTAFIWSEIVKKIWKHSARPHPYLSGVPRNLSGHDAVFSSDVQKWAVILEEMQVKGWFSLATESESASESKAES